MSEQNRILTDYTAIVNGKWTALAGCNTIDCPSRDRCLRSSEQLTSRANFKPGKEGICSSYFTNQEC